MKNKKVLRIICISLFVLIVFSILIPLVIKNISNKKIVNIDNNKSNVHVYVDENSSPIYIDDYNYTIKNEDDVFDLLDELSEMYKFKKSKDEFKVLEKTENEKITYYKMQQIYNDIPVYGNNLVVSVKDNKLLSVSGHYKKNINVSTYYSLTDDEIKEILKGENSEFEILKTEKAIYLDNDNPTLSYMVDIVSDDYKRVIIDAKTKDIIKSYSLIEQAKTSYSYTGNGALGEAVSIDITKDTTTDMYSFESQKYGFKLIDGSKTPADFGSNENRKWINLVLHVVDTTFKQTPIEMKLKNNKLLYFDSYNGNIFSNSEEIVSSGISTMNSFQKIYSYYEKLGRNSVDNKGMKLKIHINVVNDFKPYTDTKNNQYENAFWAGGDAGLIVLGFSNNIPFGVCEDVLGHEFTHGVVQYTAGLDKTILAEAGALNESYADILGSLIEGDNFEIGDKIETIRDLPNPTSKGNPSIKGEKYYFPDDTDYYNEEWKTNMLKSAKEKGNPLSDWKEWDNGGVHQNSTVPSHAAYLAYKNGAFSGSKRAAENKLKMAKVYYNSLFLLTPSSTFEDAALAVIKTAQNLGLKEDKIKIIKDAYIETKILEGIYEINGNVVDQDDKSLADVEVSLAYKSNKEIAFTTQTDKNGNYVFNDVPKGGLYINI